MGMQQVVRFDPGAPPAWEAVRELLGRSGYPVQVRMINGELAFPDEAPPEPWQELRLGTPAGMVTVRNEQGRLVFVTWGNADPALFQAWNALAWAFAEAGNGRIETGQAALTPGEFRRQADLPGKLGPVT